jgi:predicted DNA repair protein MutK
MQVRYLKLHIDHYSLRYRVILLPDAGWRSTILPLRVEEVLLAGTVMVNWEGTSEVLIVLPEGKF